jgi:hypothetical protein
MPCNWSSPSLHNPGSAKGRGLFAGRSTAPHHGQPVMVAQPLPITVNPSWSLNRSLNTSTESLRCPWSPQLAPDSASTALNAVLLTRPPRPENTPKLGPIFLRKMPIAMLQTCYTVFHIGIGKSCEGWGHPPPPFETTPRLDLARNSRFQDQPARRTKWRNSLTRNGLGKPTCQELVGKISRGRPDFPHWPRDLSCPYPAHSRRILAPIGASSHISLPVRHLPAHSRRFLALTFTKQAPKRN